MTAQVVIVGGGFSGAAAAVQLMRRATQPLVVTVIEPRAALGQGLAYSATDPDHRLNAPVDRHTVDPDDPQAFERWIAADGLVQRDPEARLPDGRCFPRRSDYGRFVADTLRAHARRPDGAAIVHRRAQAQSIERAGRGWRVHCDDGGALAADLLLVATGNPPPRLPGFVTARAAAHAHVIGNPLVPGRLDAALPAAARVWLLGSGLTALDVLSTLLRRGHAGPITVVSRRGLRPQPQPAAEQLARLQTPHRPFDPPGGPLPDFIAALGPQPGMRALVRALRARMQADAAAGLPWYAAFGALRDGVWQVWPGLAAAEKERFVRQLRIWYDVHRFLSPPQNEALVQAAVHAGAVRFRAARVSRIDVDDAGGALQARFVARGASAEAVERFDALINCTGIDASGAHNPFLQSLRTAGWLQPGPAGLGFAVDDGLCAIDRDGQAHDTLRVIGPPTLGARGDPIGAGYIALNLRRLMPDLLATLTSPGP
jgi:uncharacterized NAD(P)/FAD-binding protein YdhS